ncbi:MAG: NADH-quinone oxidoreductase subunit J [Anaerolineae bacterium]|nr:NADH-quinone oxidoreductase subunit J [Anaerolineae bacterium]
MTELAWFFVVGGLAVVAAIFMLMSDNAVHSALFLIVTMGCIAFLFLLLSAPFLAMIQITVYTGAIMVLFLFVIMLLGAERLQIAEAVAEPSRFRGYTLLAGALVVVLLVILGIALNQVDLGLSPNAGPQPELRVANAAADGGAMSVYADDELIVSNVGFREVTGYTALAPGEHTIRIEMAGGETVTMTANLEPGTEQTLVSSGAGSSLSLAVVPDDNTTLADAHTGRVTVFNASPTAVQVVDPGSEFVADDTRVMVDQLEAGQVSEALVEPEGAVTWQFVDASNPQNVLANLDEYAIGGDTSGLLILTEQRTFEGTTGGVLLPVVFGAMIDAAPAFGSPEAIGLELFTNYMLVFQLLAVLLLAAMVGAIVLVHRQGQTVTRRTGGRRRVSRPLVNVIASQVGHEVTGGDAVPELQEPAGK